MVSSLLIFRHFSFWYKINSNYSFIVQSFYNLFSLVLSYLDWGKFLILLRYKPPFFETCSSYTYFLSGIHRSIFWFALFISLDSCHEFFPLIISQIQFMWFLNEYLLIVVVVLTYLFGVLLIVGIKDWEVRLISWRWKRVTCLCFDIFYRDRVNLNLLLNILWVKSL